MVGVGVGERVGEEGVGRAGEGEVGMVGRVVAGAEVMGAGRGVGEGVARGVGMGEMEEGMEVVGMAVVEMEVEKAVVMGVVVRDAGTEVVGRVAGTGVVERGGEMVVVEMLVGREEMEKVVGGLVGDWVVGKVEGGEGLGVERVEGMVEGMGVVDLEEMGAEAACKSGQE